MAPRAVVLNLPLPRQNIEPYPLYIFKREKYLVKKGVVKLLLDRSRPCCQETVVDVALLARIYSHEVTPALVFKH
jgi:hypothetical protein